MSYINPGKYNKKIEIVSIQLKEDSSGFKKVETEKTILKVYAKVKTTAGYTLLKNDTDFEKAYTKFLIRYPKIKIKRDMFVIYNNKRYSIEYLNNVDEENIELEIQAKLVDK